jgi:carbamoyl-phosphate synthase large subunit
VLAGASLEELRREGLLRTSAPSYRSLSHVAVKAAVLPFRRFAGVDTILGPEMRSTGEVMGIASSLGLALAKAQEATGVALPSEGTVFISVANRDKRAVLMPARRLADLGFTLVATRGTAALLARSGIPATAVLKRSEGTPNVEDLIEAGEIHLVVNTPFGRVPRSDGSFIRTVAARVGIPCITTLPGVLAAVQGIEAMRAGRSVPVPLQEYHSAEAPEQGTLFRRPAGPAASTEVAGRALTSGPGGAT